MIPTLSAVSASTDITTAPTRVFTCVFTATNAGNAVWILRETDGANGNTGTLRATVRVLANDSVPIEFNGSMFAKGVRVQLVSGAGEASIEHSR